MYLSKNANQPIKERELLSGKLEPMNPMLSQNCRSQTGKVIIDSMGKVMLTIDVLCLQIFMDLDNYHPKNSHVILSLIYDFMRQKG